LRTWEIPHSGRWIGGGVANLAVWGQRQIFVIESPI
jgi:hypothetical protein